MKILLLGANGQVGSQLERSLACLSEVIACQRKGVDLTDENALQTLLPQLKPNLIVNAAAYTAVDKAEQEKTLAYQINTKAPQLLAEYAAQQHIPLIHYSTDYVFDGSNASSWVETDATNPLNYYGETKLQGELAIQQSGCQHVIFRTSWVYDWRGQNFLNTMLRLAETRDALNIVDDQFGTPTWSRHIADVTAQVISQSFKQSDFWQDHSGLYHLSAAGKTTWKDFAEAIFTISQTHGKSAPKVTGITTEEYPTPAQRPRNSCLNNQKLADHFGMRLPDWRQSLQWVMQT